MNPGCLGGIKLQLNVFDVIGIIPVDVWLRPNKNGKPLEMRKREITSAASVLKAEDHGTSGRLIFEKKREKNGGGGV